MNCFPAVASLIRWCLEKPDIFQLLMPSFPLHSLSLIWWRGIGLKLLPLRGMWCRKPAERLKSKDTIRQERENGGIALTKDCNELPHAVKMAPNLISVFVDSLSMAMWNLMTCGRHSDSPPQVLCLWHVLFDKVTQQMVSHQSSTHKCNTNWKRHKCLRQIHLDPLLAPTAVTSLMNPTFRRNHHSLKFVFQMERPMSR